MMAVSAHSVSQEGQPLGNKAVPGPNTDCICWHLSLAMRMCLFEYDCLPSCKYVRRAAPCAVLEASTLS